MNRFARRMVLTCGSLLAVVLPLEAVASCLYPAACYEVSGVIEKCREIRQDEQGFLELTFKAPIVRQTPCSGETRAPIGTELQDRQKYLDSRKHFYVGKWSRKACADLNTENFSGTVEETCCDTPPGTGSCALDGPLLIPREP